MIGGSLKTVFPCSFRFVEICFACFQAAYFLPEQAFRRLPRAGASPCTPRGDSFRLPNHCARAHSVAQFVTHHCREHSGGEVA